MRSQSTQYYLFILTKHFDFNISILSILLIIEILPLMYSAIQSAFIISNKTPPLTIFQNLFYISYYEIISRNMNENHRSILFILLFFLFIVYLFFKFIGLKFESIRKNHIFIKIFILFYELVIFRFCAIIFFGISIHKITKSNNINIIYGFSIFIFVFIWFFYHYHSHFIYISLNSITPFSFNNKIIQISDKYFLILKSLACLCNHLNEHSHFCLFINVSLISIIILSLFHILYIVLCNKYSYFPKNYLVYIRVWFTFFILFVQFYIIMTIEHSYQVILFVFIYIAIVSLFITLLLQKLSELKLQLPNNEIGNIFFLLYQHNSPISDKDVTSMIHYHLSMCKRKECFYCSKVKSLSQKNTISLTQLIKILYKSIKSSNEINIDKSNEIYGIKLLLELALMNLSGKSFTKIIIKYNKIRMMFNSKKNIYNPKKRVYYSFSEKIKNNYEVIFHEIKLNALNNIKNPKINYLITIDNIISNIEKFFKKLKNFLKSELKRPKDIVDLAKNVSSLKKEINISFLSEKENKMCYSCVLVNFIIE